MTTYPNVRNSGTPVRFSGDIVRFSGLTVRNPGRYYEVFGEVGEVTHKALCP